MNDHDKAELVNLLAVIARTYHDNQEELREHIRDALLPALDRLERYWAHEAGAVVAQVAQNLSQPRADLDWGAVDQELTELLGRYWDLAYAEGRDGRTHDTTDGAAQRTLSDLRTLLRKVSQQ
jgi:uncharacterized membrane protein YccC